MLKKTLPMTLLLQGCFFITYCEANTNSVTTIKRPLYAGVIGGYGSTTWEGLVPAAQNQNAALNLSTPVDVAEGGGVWGGFVGYELIPTFAIETSYMRYPDATVSFDPLSLFSYLHSDLTEFVTHTETVSLMGKAMFFIPKTDIRAFSSAGIATIHRNDLLTDEWRVSPTFGVGFNYQFTTHLMGELGGNYTAGFGESDLNPTETYFPFLYSVTLRLAYCI